MTNDPALIFRSVRRTFRKTVALDRIDLAVDSGTVLGLVGRNGAGKTTALRLALGDLYPDSGEVRTLGLDPVTEGRAVRERVSLLSEESSLYPWMRVGEILRFAAGLHPRWDDDLATKLGERLGLETGRKIATLSRGNRAKVGLVLAVACRPEMLLLDDPTAGLDPLVRREVLEGVLDTIHAEGGTVLYASHLIHDIERVADRVVVLDEGRISLDGKVDALKASIRRVTAVFPGEAPVGVDLPGRLRTQSEGRVLQVVAEAGEEELAALLHGAGARAVDFETLSLEDILVACLGEDAAADGEESSVSQEVSRV